VYTKEALGRKAKDSYADNRRYADEALVLCDPSILLVVLVEHRRNTCCPDLLIDAAMALDPEL
jgi:hypothetical protein